MSDEQKKAGDITINPFMDVLNKFQKSGQERAKIYEKKHLALVANPEELRIFYEDVARLDTWLLHSEAIPYCRAVEPSQWSSIEHGYRDWTDKLTPLIKAGVGVTLMVINPDAKEKDWRVKPKEFVKWLHSKGMRPRKELEDVLSIQYKVKKEIKTSVHQNVEVNAQKREQILFAALSVLSRWPDECKKKNGQISASAIANLIEQKSIIWFGYDELPLEKRGMINLISKSLKSTLD